MTDSLRPVNIRVKVTPRGSRNQILGMERGALKIKLTAPPVEGRANKALKEFLSKKLGLSKQSIEIVGGEKSRLKTIQIQGLTEKDVFRLLMD